MTPRIHLALSLPALLLVSASCNDKSPDRDLGIPKGVLRVASGSGPDVGLRPGQEAYLRVLYTLIGGDPLPGRSIRFAFYGDPRGSTLSADSAVTSASGEARIRLSAGSNTSRYEVRASGPGGESATFNIVVSDAAFGSVLVKSSYDGAVPQLKLARLTYYLYSGLTCGTQDPVAPGGYQRKRDASALAQGVGFSALPLNEEHTLFVTASDSEGHARASGCAGLLKDTLRSDRTLTLTLRLSDLRPLVKGGYALSSEFTIPGTSGSSETWPRPLARALQPWADLADCPNDPAQLILDCVLDALDGGDPADCEVVSPSARTRALLAERGVPGGACRSNVTGRGTSSLDRKLRQAMDNSGSTTLAALPGLEPGARAAIKSFTLGSRLELLELDRDGAAVASHLLESVAFSSGATRALYKTAAVGLAQVQASPVKAVVSELKVPGYYWQLTLDRHALSLQFGLLSRDAVGKLVLIPAGLPPGSAALTTKLAGLVQTSSAGKTLTGCAAIEALACEAARLGPGCLGSACAAGLAALAARLDAGFEGLDQHKGDDLTLAGEVNLTDVDGDLKPDTLGSSSTPGVWTSRMQLAEDQVQPREATFTGKRSN